MERKLHVADPQLVSLLQSLGSFHRNRNAVEQRPIATLQVLHQKIGPLTQNPRVLAAHGGKIEVDQNGGISPNHDLVVRQLKP
jgi:hypothetical protein